MILQLWENTIYIKRELVNKARILHRVAVNLFWHMLGSLIFVVFLLKAQSEVLV